MPRTPYNSDDASKIVEAMGSDSGNKDGITLEFSDCSTCKNLIKRKVLISSGSYKNFEPNYDCRMFSEPFSAIMKCNGMPLIMDCSCYESHQKPAMIDSVGPYYRENTITNAAMGNPNTDHNEDVKKPKKKRGPNKSKKRSNE